MCMKLQVNANAVITNSEGKFLFIKLKGGPFKDGLCIPGGRIEPGELAHDTAKREVLEETGINVASLTPFGFCECMQDKSQNHRVVTLFHGTGEGIPIETEEGIGQWVSAEEAKENAIPFAREAIRIWQEKKLHFTVLE